MADWRSVVAIVGGILIGVLTSRWWLPPLLASLRGVTIDAIWADKTYHLNVSKAEKVISQQTAAILDPDWGVVSRLMAIPGVTAVEFGPKEVRGERLDTLAFRVRVKHKRPLSDLGPEEIIPNQIGGIPTDVLEEG